MSNTNIGNFYDDNEININNWGQSYWYIIHLIALRYNGYNKKEVIYFYKYLACILPCSKCQHPQTGYPKFYNDNDITPYLIDNVELFKWTHKLHNWVNIKTGKSTFPYNETQAFYLFSNIGIKYGHFINFLLNLSQICNRFKEKQRCSQINHVIANILFIIKKCIPEFGQFIKNEHLKIQTDTTLHTMNQMIPKNKSIIEPNVWVGDTRNIILLLLDTIVSIKNAKLVDLKTVQRSVSEKCYGKCNK